MPLPPINPPVINSANPWATTLSDLQTLFDSPFTGAVTTRTSLLDGFDHDPSIHQFAFFDPATHTPSQPNNQPASPSTQTATLNTLGYSPHPLSYYLTAIRTITTSHHNPTKPFIISITGPPKDILTAYQQITALQATLPTTPLAVELNLSCPNIPSLPPPAYSLPSLLSYLTLLAPSRATSRVPLGLKIPPYTYHDQFTTLISALKSTNPCCVDFLTATNTLGSALLLSPTPSSSPGAPALASASGAGTGGLAGSPLHALALGNVRILRGLLDAEEGLRAVEIIGVGGVRDLQGAERMRGVGARVVGVGSALGSEGVGVFERVCGGRADAKARL